MISASSGLTLDGNLTLVDDIGPTTGAGQQFITLTTKTGNVFYLVIDRDNDGNENVYFMNLVDEANLFALLDEDAQADYTEKQLIVAVTEMEEKQEETAEETTESEPEVKTEKKSNWASIMLLAIVAIGGIGVAGYSFVNKKKQAKAAEKPDPDADYQDEDEEEYEIHEENDSEENDAGGEEEYAENNQPDADGNE